MKTKKILTILAVPAFLAACTAENDILMDNAQELAGRKVLDSKVNIGFVSADQLDSRLSMGADAVTLDSDDKIAAALIDKVSTSNNLVNGYEITAGIATNHPFTTTDNKNWITPTQLVEGNYLFYYQYNPTLAGNRGAAVPYTIAKNQFAYAKDAKTVFVADQAVKDNAVGIGYAYLGADADGYTPTNVSVQMYNLFSFLQFNIKTDKTGLEVQQIKVTPKKEGFTLSGKISNSAVAGRGVLAADRKTVTDENPGNAGLLYVPSIANTTCDNPTYTSTFRATETTAKTDYIILSLPDLAVDATAKSAYVVIPAEDYAVSGENKPEFEILAYTNQGVFKREVELSAVGETEPKDYSKLTIGTVQPISLNITGELVAADEYFVGSADEWQKVIKSLPALTSSTTKTIKIEILNKVELSKADIDLIQSTNAKSYSLDINGEAVVLTESCDLNDIDIEKVTVNSGVIVGLNKNAKVGTLNNNGTVNVNAVSGTGNVVAKVTTLDNFGIANIKQTAAVTALVNGSSAAKADNSAVEVNVKAGVYTVGNLTNNKGANVTVATGAELKAKGMNSGNIEVNGTFITNGEFTNNAGGAIDAKTNSIVTNSATDIKNAGDISAAAGADITVGDNGDGIITYSDGAVVAVNGAKGKIAYRVTSDYLVPTAQVEYNTIVVDGLNIKLTDGVATSPSADLVDVGITNIIVKNNSELNVALVPSDDLTLVEVEGKNTIITSEDGLNTKTLKVAKNAYLTIPLYSVINVTTKDMVSSESGKLGLQNLARINVGGTLTYYNSDAWKTESTAWVTVGELLGSGTKTVKSVNVAAVADGETLEAAIAAKKYVVLTDNVSIDQDLNVISNAIIDLNGKTITLNNKSSLIPAENVEMKVSNGTLISEGSAIYTYNTDEKEVEKLVLDNCIIKKDGSGCAVSIYKAKSFEIKDCSIESAGKSTDNPALKIYGSKGTIKNSVIGVESSEKGGVYMTSSEVSINGGEIYSNGDYEVYLGYGGNNLEILNNVVWTEIKIDRQSGKDVNVFNGVEYAEYKTVTVVNN